MSAADVTLPPGTLVTYEDEDPGRPSVTGLTVEPTAADLAAAAAFSDPVGPAYGDVLVDWDDEAAPVLGRTWHNVHDLIPVAKEAAL